MVTIQIPLFVLASGLSMVMSVQAGTCREVLHPLLLQTPPAQAELLGAQELCAAEAEAGDADATYQSALLHLGLIDWDPDRAIPMIQTAADHGIAEAQYWLAWQYDEGPLLPDNSDLARHWYEQAGDNEHRLALDRLAIAYRNGELGLEASATKAAEMKARAERCKDQAG